MDWLALYGAVVGTAALVWTIYSTVREQANIQVLSPPKFSYTPQVTGGLFAERFGINYEVTVMNSGQKPLTIASVDVRLGLRSDEQGANPILPPK